MGHPEAQATHEAIINLLQGVDSGEITVAHCVRLLRSQAVLVAEVPASAALYRQAAASIQQMQREEHSLRLAETRNPPLLLKEVRMPAADFDAHLLSEVHLRLSRGFWHVIVRYGERRYKLGEWHLYADAHRACSASAIEKALGSPDKRARHLVAEEY